MADEIKNARAGLKTRLETIAGLRVYAYAPDNVLEFPAAVIAEVAELDDDMTMTGGDIEAVFRLQLYVRSADTEQAQADLDAYLDPAGSKSIRAAIEGDSTLDGQVDWARREGLEETERIDVGLVRADVLVRWYKSG